MNIMITRDSTDFGRYEERRLRSRPDLELRMVGYCAPNESSKMKMRSILGKPLGWRASREVL